MKRLIFGLVAQLFIFILAICNIIFSAANLILCAIMLLASTIAIVATAISIAKERREKGSNPQEEHQRTGELLQIPDKVAIADKENDLT